MNEPGDDPGSPDDGRWGGPPVARQGAKRFAIVHLDGVQLPGLSPQTCSYIPWPPAPRVDQGRRVTLHRRWLVSSVALSRHCSGTSGGTGRSSVTLTAASANILYQAPIEYNPLAVGQTYASAQIQDNVERAAEKEARWRVRDEWTQQVVADSSRAYV